MQTDRLEALLSRFRVSARLFHSGPLCGVNDFAPEQGRGQLHLLGGGELRVEHPDGSALAVGEPSLLFYPRPHAHRFISDDTRGADMACAFIEFGDGARNPLTAALPAFVVLPLSALDGAGPRGGIASGFDVYRRSNGSFRACCVAAALTRFSQSQPKPEIVRC
mgnify:CR=1 FL=1